MLSRCSEDLCNDQDGTGTNNGGSDGGGGAVIVEGNDPVVQERESANGAGRTAVNAVAVLSLAVARVIV